MVGYIRKFSHIYIHIYILECKRASEINIYLVNVERENIAIPTDTHSYTLFYPVTSRAILFNEFSTLSLMVHSRALLAVVRENVRLCCTTIYKMTLHFSILPLANNISI